MSEKYILACDSPTLYVKTRFHDFFSRGLVPGRHYWPIPRKDKCGSIKFAVDWGNSHKKVVIILIFASYTHSVIQTRDTNSLLLFLFLQISWGARSRRGECYGLGFVLSRAII